MDYVVFILLILALAAALYFLRRSDIKTKNKHKLEAYRLLDMPTVSREDIMKSIKMLRLYGGRWKKDKEFLQLIDRLIAKLEKTDAA